MTWVRMDDQFHSHPKLAMLSDLQLPCVGLHIMAICWSAQYLTDGFIPYSQPDKLAGNLESLLPMGKVDPLVIALVRAGMWEEVWESVDEDKEKLVGYKIHDYLEYNPSKAQVQAERAQKVAAGQAGGQASAQARAQAEGKQASSRRSTNLQAKSNPVPVPVPVPDPEPLTTTPTADEAAVFTSFEEEEIGALTPYTAQQLNEMIDERGATCVIHCIQEAAVSNVRNWPYFKAIWDRHGVEGCEAVVKSNGYRPGSKRGKPTEAHNEIASLREYQAGLKS